MFRLLTALAFLIVALPIACSTPPLPLKSYSLEQLAAPKTSIILNYDLISEHRIIKEYGCRIVLENKDNAKLSTLPMVKGGEAVLAEIAPGNYEFHSLTCDTARTWTISDLIATSQFSILEGKIHFLGKYRFTIAGDTAEKLTVGYASLQERASLGKTLKRLPRPIHKAFVSAYTGKRILRSMLKVADEKTAQFWPYISYTKPKGFNNKSAEAINFKTCIDKEKQLNPLRIGTLRVSAFYQDNALKTLKRDKKSQHVYTESFAFCIEDVLRQFKPGTKAKLSYRVRF